MSAVQIVLVTGNLPTVLLLVDLLGGVTGLPHCHATLLQEQVSWDIEYHSPLSSHYPKLYAGSTRAVYQMTDAPQDVGISISIKNFYRSMEALFVFTRVPLITVQMNLNKKDY